MTYAVSQSESVERERARAHKHRENNTVFAPPSEFRGSAEEIQSICNHEWMIAGPAETGKTFSALWRLDAELRRTKKAQASLVRKTAADIAPTVLRTYQRILGMHKGKVEAYGGNHPEWFDYKDSGARLWIGGMDRPGKVLSGERDFIYVNQAEELSLEDWETLTTRATGRGAVTQHPMVFGDCNPGPPTHWIINRPSLKVLYSKHEDNPTLYTREGALTEQGTRTMAVLNALTGVRYKRLRLGLWVAAEGTVYDFDRSTHLIDRRVIPPDWVRFRSIDFGFTNPFVCQWWAIDPDGRLYLYREIYHTQRTVKVHTEKIKELERWGTSEQERIAFTVCDHDAEDRATLAENGISTIGAMKAVSRGIQAVEERMKIAKDDKPRLYILRDSLVERDESLAEKHLPLCTEQEFDMYMWPKGLDGKPVKEEPVKLYDHGMDACRYAVMHQDAGRASERAWEE